VTSLRPCRSTASPRGGRVNVLKSISRYRRRFRAGQTLEVRVTAPDKIGKVVRYKLVRGRSPIGGTLCLPPGTSSPRRCAGSYARRLAKPLPGANLGASTSPAPGSCPKARSVDPGAASASVPF
jgi:hypothetical protein